MAPLTIALVNNMPDAALERTEKQFRDLLARAGAGIELRLRVFLLPGPSRSESALAYQRDRCEAIDALYGTRGIDGLIVTGTEPRSMAIEQEPSWPALSRLFDWAAEHAASTIFSCHAAHAAVFHFDGIRRRRLPHKLFGLFECAKAADHPLLEGVPQRWLVPQSRHNDVPATELAAHGYAVLAQSPAAGADIFARDGKSLMLFLQGHLEYDAAALLGEYRRDIRRFLTGERTAYPALPQNYFAPGVAAMMEDFAARATAQRDLRLLTEFPAAAAQRSLSKIWDEPALQLYRNWLGLLGRRAGQAGVALACAPAP